MEWYRWILALHVIAIISWMAGILYLYRLLVYASEQGRSKADVYALLSLMARRLYRYITRPAMIVAWLAGITMLTLNPGLFASGWLHVKLAAVILLTVSTFYAGSLVRRYGETDLALPTSRRLRMLNEAPTLLMIVIVIMVIVRPF